LAINDDTWRDEILKEIDSLQKKIDVLVDDERTLKDELQKIKQVLQPLRDHRERLTNRLQSGHNGRRLNGAADPMVVKVAELQPHLKRYLDTEGYGAVSKLSRASGIGEKSIRRLRDNEQEHVTLYVLEDLLIAMNCEHWLQNGTLTVVPNPLIMHGQGRQ